MANPGFVVPVGVQNKEGFHGLRRTTEGLLYYTKVNKDSGDTIDFEGGSPTDKNGNTRKHRVFVKDTTAQGLVKIPQEDTYKLLQRQKDLNNKAIKTDDDLAELEVIAEELCSTLL